MYASDDRKQIVNSQEELEALGEGWYDSPAKVPAAAPEDDDENEPKVRKKATTK